MTRRRSPGNRAAVDEALAKGHKIVVTTGRALASGLRIAERVGLTGEGCYVIAFNGGQIYDPYHRETIHGVTFSQDTAAEIFEKAVERNLYMQAYSDEAILTVENNELLQQYAKVQNLPYKIVKTQRMQLFRIHINFWQLTMTEAKVKHSRKKFFLNIPIP